MPLRRIGLLGAAALAAVAALVAIAAVLGGSFGGTEAKIFATLGTAFVAGSAIVAGIACLERGDRVLGTIGVALACGGFLLWTEEVWAQHHGSAYWKLLWLALIWTLATLLVTTTSLMTKSPDLRRTLFVATAGAAVAAALAASTMTVREDGGGWQLFAVLLILAVLGAILTPILQRFVVSPTDGPPRERLLGVTVGAEVVAVRTASARRVVRVDGRDVALADDEMVVIRPA